MRYDIEVIIKLKKKNKNGIDPLRRDKPTVIIASGSET